MNGILKIATVTIISAVVVTVAGCNTVTGAFQGAGADTRAAANALQLNDSSGK